MNMYRIIDSRGSGKTSRLLLLAKETGATVVCSNPRAMREKSYAYGITGVNFLSYQEALCSEGCVEDFLIDEIELFARHAIGRNRLVGYSLSNED